MRINLVTAAVCVAVFCGTGVEAQTSAASRGYISLKGGANIESAEDNLHGATAGAGAVLGINVWDKWTIEGEFWFPGAIRTSPEDGRHRDTLASADFRRSFGEGRVSPHLLVGLSVGWTEDKFTTCTAMRPTFGSATAIPMLVSCADADVIERRQERFSSVGLFPLVGGGVEIALTDRIRLIPDIRIQVWITSVIVRPAIAIGVVF